MPQPRYTKQNTPLSIYIENIYYEIDEEESMLFPLATATGRCRLEQLHCYIKNQRKNKIYPRSDWPPGYRI